MANSFYRPLTSPPPGPQTGKSTASYSLCGVHPKMLPAVSVGMVAKPVQCVLVRPPPTSSAAVPRGKPWSEPISSEMSQPELDAGPQHSATVVARTPHRRMPSPRISIISGTAHATLPTSGRASEAKAGAAAFTVCGRPGGRRRGGALRVGRRGSGRGVGGGCAVRSQLCRSLLARGSTLERHLSRACGRIQGPACVVLRHLLRQ